MQAHMHSRVALSATFLIVLPLQFLNACIDFGVEVEEAPWGFEIDIRDVDGNRLGIGMPKTSSR